MQFEKKLLKKKSENISDWYTDVLLKAQLVDYGPVKGTMVIRPYGYAIWERVQQILNEMMQTAGVENAYFPLFIPYSLLAKEKEHVAGFSPELALVTKGGGEELKDPYVVRPTSETIMYEMYSKWIQSWRDLPVKINQWNNVVRWEKRTYLFLRTLEFLWQEGHCAHVTHEESKEMVLLALDWYRKVYEDYYAIPVIAGLKSEAEKFAGALSTYSIEALMPDGKALQGATSHDLGQHFSKAYGISFQNQEGKLDYVWQNSWGFSTRTLGALFLVHGDDNGLLLPPKIAPTQIVIVPIQRENPTVMTYAETVFKELSKNLLRVRLDTREGWTPGRKFNDWELRGVPLRLEIGDTELSAQTVTAVRRDSGEKMLLKKDQLPETTKKLLDEIQNGLAIKAKDFLKANTHVVDEYGEFKKIMAGPRGFIRAFWCGDADCEAKVKAETKATVRCLPIRAKKEKGNCIYCKKPAELRWYFAQAY